VFPERIEKLRQDYTEKYVVVDEERPELARFREMVGQVKTINVNGRALVEFDANDDHGRYDIELDFLRVVDKPEPKPPAEKAKAAGAKKAQAEKKDSAAKEESEEKLSPLELARMEKQAAQPAEKADAGEGPASGPSETSEKAPADPPGDPVPGEGTGPSDAK
jgi:hypothetical protein